MTIRMRHTRAHSKNRRSHHAVTGAAVTTDQDSGTTHLRHRASSKTGQYRGRTVIDMVKKVAKKQARNAQEK